MRMTQSTQWIRDFVDWCQWNHLLINNEKTKEPVMDFHRRRSTTPTPVEIQRTGIEILDSYKYLSVHLNKKLDWSHNTDALYRKGQSRLYLLRKLRCFLTLWRIQASSIALSI